MVFSDYFQWNSTQRFLIMRGKMSGGSSWSWSCLYWVKKKEVFCRMKFCVTVSDRVHSLIHHLPRRLLCHLGCSNKFQKCLPSRDTSERARRIKSTKCESTDRMNPRRLVCHRVKTIHYTRARRVLSVNGDMCRVQLPITFLKSFFERFRGKF